MPFYNFNNGSLVLIFLDILRVIKKSYSQAKAVIGLSNISFGLSERKFINQAFMLLAMALGIDAAIIDPADKRLMAFIKVAKTLLWEAPFCREYIRTYREGELNID